MDWESAEREWRGAVVLVGLTLVDGEGSLVRQEQFAGQVMSVSREHGVELDLFGNRGGERYWLPPQLDAFKRAAPGEYRLRSTGEVVIDPDLISTWTVQAPTDA